MSLDRGGRTSIKPGFEVIMSNQDKLFDIHKKKQAAKNRLNEAIRDLEKLGIDIEGKCCGQDSSRYSEELITAFKKYIDAKNNLSTFP